MSEPRDLGLVRNTIAILGALDRDELAGMPMTDGWWVAFRDDPCRVFLTSSSERRAAIWAAVQRRLPACLREKSAEREADHA